MSDILHKRCATVMACASHYRDSCKYAHASVRGNVQFFVPTETGERCHSYIPYMKPYGEGPDNDAD